MNGRVLLTGVLAGVGMYAWSSVAHMLLPLGEIGIQQMTNEQTVLGPMQANLGAASGLYMFPNAGTGSSQEKMQTYQAKIATSPSGMLIYHPPGAIPSMGWLLSVEFLTELAVACLAVLLLAQTRLTGFAARAGFVAIIGVISAGMTNVQYWNWYGYPGNYTIAYIFTQWMGFLVAGCIAAAMLKSAPRAIQMAA